MLSLVKFKWSLLQFKSGEKKNNAWSILERERESMAAVLALGLSNCIRLASCMLTPNGRGQSKRLAREDTCLHRPRSSAGSCILCFVAGFNL